nr:hypothetical protein [Bryobacter aggregatus]
MSRNSEACGFQFGLPKFPPVGGIEPGNVPTVPGKEERIAPLSHSDVQCASRFAVPNRFNQ